MYQFKRSTSSPLRRSAALLTVAFMMALVGCSATPTSSVEEPSNRGSLPELLQSSLSEASSGFEKDVLERAIKTGEIAAADYEEAVSKYLTCVTGDGVDLDAVMQPNGIYKWKPNNVSDLDSYGEITNRCADGTVMRIEGLYKLQVVNPGMLPNNEAVVKCLSDNGVAPNGYDATQFDKDVENGFSDTPLDVKNDLTVMCLNSLGYSVG